MMLVTAAQMREIDRIAIREIGIAGIQLMERAGSEVAAAIIEEFGPVAAKRVVVVAGKGNNGGDGFVAARRLLEAGAAPRVILAGAREDVSGVAAEVLARAEEAGVPVHAAGAADATPERASETLAIALNDALSRADIAVDALLGTGAAGAPRGLVAEAIRILAAFAAETPRRPVVAIDIPSGVDADTGVVAGPAVRADLTVTLALAKPGLFLYPGRAHAGAIRVADIGVPAEAFARAATMAASTRLFDGHAPRALRLPARAPDAHKGVAGRVVVVGASPGLTGAVYLAGMAALRAGAGLVTLAVPRGVQPILAAKATELMTLGLSETKAHLLGSPAARELLDFAENFDVIAIGPGLGRGAEVRAFVSDVLDGWRGRVVVDADALWSLANGLARLRGAGESSNTGVSDLVVTPHLGEAERLSGEARDEIAADRIAFVRRCAQTMAGTFLLKGNPTIVADQAGGVTLNTTGNSGMATTGAGDVLTGVIAGLLAQGMRGADAARAGAWLHGRAGDIAAAAHGFRSLIATDILDALSPAIREADERG
ncbi:MAG: NAD(P)H-hydrate dehydratase [bacterium]